MIVPAGELVQIRLAGDGPDGRDHSTAPHTQTFAVRLLLLAGCVACGSSVPDFALVLGLTGCMCVGVISFVLPALFHMILLGRSMGRDDIEGKPTAIDLTETHMLWTDRAMLALGTVATFVSTFQTISAIRHGSG